MTSEAVTRTVNDVPVPAPGVYTIDPLHTTIGFSVRHLLVGRVRGTFDRVDGTIEIGATEHDSRVSVSIETASVHTGVPDRDQHLRSAEFLDADRYPAMTFHSNAFGGWTADGFTLAGTLTIRDITRPVILTVQSLGVVRAPTGKLVCAFEAGTTLDREEFGITLNWPLETGGVAIAKDVSIEISVEAIHVD